MAEKKHDEEVRGAVAKLRRNLILGIRRASGRSVGKSKRSRSKSRRRSGGARKRS